MTPSQDDKNLARLRQTAEEHADEIFTRRLAARQSRAAALEGHAKTINLKTELTHAHRMGVAAVAPVSRSTQSAGYLLAVGDSWFDYPVNDVLTKLEDQYGYSIESSAHKGDPIETMISRVGQLDKFARNLDKIVSIGATPKAILISGGGDDIAGDEFGMLLNNLDLPIGGWNEQVVAGVIDTRIASACRLMVAKINAYCTKDLGRTFPILIHGYDYPVPDGRGFLGGWGPLPGPWLKPGFDEKLFSDLTQTTKMIATLIDRFNVMLAALVKEPGMENVHYVDLRGTLSNQPSEYKKWWANELHPTGGGIIGKIKAEKDGFAAIAAILNKVLLTLP